MITLKALNTDLVNGQAYSYLLTNYASGVSSFDVLCGTHFSANDYVLIGEFGQENAEIIKVSSVSGDTLSLASSTSFAHAESTRVTIVPYNQIVFYRTTDTTYSTDSPLAAAQDVSAVDLYSVYEDSTNTTGYGWFAFYNETTTLYSTHSNYIPYTDFAGNTAQSIIEKFLRGLNQEDSKLISFEDAFSWLSDGYSIACSELNLVNREYKTDDAYSITCDGSTSEYDLPSTASKLVSVWNATRKSYASEVKLDKLDEANENTGATPKYFLRGMKIGFAPVNSDTFTVRYLTKTSIIDELTDTIDLPDNNYSILYDYLNFRAADRLGRTDKADSYTLFGNSIERMKTGTTDRNVAGSDSWGRASGTNV